MALTEFEEGALFWFSRFVRAQERIAIVAEETLKIDKECAAIEEEPEKVGKTPELIPLYTPEFRGEVD